MRYVPAWLATCTLAACSGRDPGVSNSHPVHLVRAATVELSAVALLGRALFHDSALSAAGNVSCASCHRPDHFHEPVDASPAHLAGSVTTGLVLRSVPSLRYAYRAPNFSIGPEAPDADSAVDLVSMAKGAANNPHVVKRAGDSIPVPMVPLGGQFWDGRANTLQDQAAGPLFNPAEMANRDMNTVAATLRRASYAGQFTQLFGADVLNTPSRLVDEAMFAIARYQVEDSAFHSYTSKYDYYLEGRATLSAAEARGLAVFEDRRRGNCAACHLDRALPDGTPPAFTDYEYETLAVPRNDSLAANRDPGYFDLGLCGPLRRDLSGQAAYCGMFRTPSLRNVATRSVFFHNGRYRSLDSVVAFYNSRDTRPELIYPVSGDRMPRKFDDLPPRYHANVDTIDAPFDRRRGDPPAMSDRDRRDLVAFLRTLTDGYLPGDRPKAR